jgi:pheromone shutdown protein TraB
LINLAHFSRASQEDVKKTIAETQPDVIFVELCNSRVAILSMDEQVLLREAQNLNREKIMAIVKENGVVQGMLQVMLLSISAHITSQLGGSRIF